MMRKIIARILTHPIIRVFLSFARSCTHFLRRRRRLPPAISEEKKPSLVIFRLPSSYKFLKSANYFFPLQIFFREAVTRRF